MGKDLYNFLAIHHLFDITVDGSEITLLRNKVFGTGSTYHFGGIEHNTDHEKCDDRQWDI